MNRVSSFFMAVVAFFSALFSGGGSQSYFKNEYTIPESTSEYKQLDTTPKED